MKCPNCNGTGTTPHKHIADGICFTCNGTGLISYDPEKHDDLSLFMIGERFEIDGTPVKMIKGCGRINKGGEFVAKCDGEFVYFWNKKAGANWHIKVPKQATELMKKHFKRI